MYPNPPYFYAHDSNTSSEKLFCPPQHGQFPLREQATETDLQSRLVRRHGLLIAKLYFLQMKLLFFIPSELGLAEGLYPAKKIVV